MIINSLKQIVSQNTETDPLYLRNLLKENIQYYVLNFVYSSKWGENLLLKGGSCLRMFFNLPRLSEDVDLDILDKNSFFLDEFVEDLKDYFSATLQYKELGVKVSGKENIIYLKFPVFKPQILFLRIDLAEAVGKKYKTELALKSTSDFSFLVKRYSIEDLFSGKIVAILQREAGRDYFDLAWFLEKGITPNLKYLQEIIPIKNNTDLKTKLKRKIKKLDLEILRQDLMPLFRDKNFVLKFVTNYKKLALGEIDKRFRA